MLDLSLALDFGVLVAVITALTQVIKPFVPKNLVPVVSLLLGVIAGIMLGGGVPMANKVVYGLILGLTASGLFDLSKVYTKRQ
jgi:hypothetical protein